MYGPSLTSWPLTVFTHAVSEPLGGPSPICFVPGGQGGAVLQAASAAASIMSTIPAFILGERGNRKASIYTICCGSATDVLPSVVSFRRKYVFVRAGLA